MRVTIENGKYTLGQHANGRLYALRHGKPWEAFEANPPDNLHLALAQEVERLQEQLKAQVSIQSIDATSALALSPEEFAKWRKDWFEAVAKATQTPRQMEPLVDHKPPPSMFFPQDNFLGVARAPQEGPLEFAGGGDAAQAPCKKASDFASYIPSFQSEAAALHNSGVSAGIKHVTPFLEAAQEEAKELRCRVNAVYLQRNELAVAFVKLTLLAGGVAGRGRDDKLETDADWSHVVYANLPNGRQVSWHMSPDALPLLEGLPQYAGVWDGSFIARGTGWSRELPVAWQRDVPRGTLGGGLIFPTSPAQC